MYVSQNIEQKLNPVKPRWFLVSSTVEMCMSLV